MEHDYHFNEWAFLAQADPEAFERRRREYIEQFLRQSGHRREYLEPLQAMIDAERELAGSPRAAMLAICRMMADSLAELHGAMSSLSSDLKQLQHLGADVVSANRPLPAAAVEPAERAPSAAGVDMRRAAGPPRNLRWWMARRRLSL